MRVLNVASGLAALLMALHFVHFIPHFAAETAHTPSFWAALVGGVLIDIFCFIGGCLLVFRSRMR